MLMSTRHEPVARVSDGIRRAVNMNKICTTGHAIALDVESIPFFAQLKRLPRKLKITGMQPRSFHVMTRTKLDSLLQLVKAL